MNIQPSQVILIGALLVFGFYVFRLRTVLADRVILFLLSIGGIVLVIHPNFAMTVANRIGIGRGTDLLLYFFIIFSLFAFAGYSAQIKNLERQITLLTRQDAIHNAVEGGAKEGEPPQNDEG
jgi:hypothetical protein